MKTDHCRSSVAELIGEARKAQVLWAALPYSVRAKKLKKASYWLCTHIDELVETIHRENGKLRLDALAAEVLPAIMGMGYYIRRGRSFLKGRKLAGASLLMFNKRSRLEYRPWGVVGIISPWNYPFAIPFSEVVMALLAGNAVILKTASVTTAVGRFLAELFAAADLPPGLFNYVELPGREAGPAFITGDGGSAGVRAGVDKLFFTGSTAVGRELMALAAPHLLPLVLELGGADAAVVRADADLDRAAAGILWAAYSNAGQSCGGVQRILVQRPVYQAFLEKFCALVSGLRPGWDENADLGPMTSREQKEKAEAQIAECLAQGAKIAARSPVEGAASSAPNPFADRFTAALVLTGVKPGMPIMEEEIFGPVTAVIPVDDDEEALRTANDSPYGLTASVWSRDRRAAARLASRLNAGAVMLNDHLMSHGLAESPWGGFGDSGLGKTHGEPGFREMLRLKVVVDDILPGVKKDLWWQPYSPGVYRGIRAIAAFLGGPGLAARLRAVPGVLKIFFRYWDKSS
ncbi:MAG: aldehyde dehydrogenase family protein [Treponema sp.]|jgi:succinate-semialdehyde dehydrogenase/glutarate-semialdehyde dehydrogenase|nr:aldehyde dehydrogenase family protein [Treponema sp.]